MNNKERDLLWLFDSALILKVIHGVFEVVAAILVLVIPPAFVMKAAEFITAGELAQEPNDFIATTILTAAQTFAVHPHFFIALYLALHGVIKVILIIGIFAGKRIAYPLFMVSLSLFGVYEVYRGFARQELLLYVLAIFDFLLIILTVHEYRLRYPTHLYLRTTQEDHVGR